MLFVVLPTAIMLAFSFGQRDDLGDVVFHWTAENYARLADRRAVRPMAGGHAVYFAAVLTIALLRRAARRAAAAETRWRFSLAVVFWTSRSTCSVLGDTGDAESAGKWLKISRRQSVNYAAASTALCVLILAYPVAFYIGRGPRAGRRDLLVMVLVTIPFWTSFLVRTYAWVTILRDEGLLNSACCRACT